MNNLSAVDDILRAGIRAVEAGDRPAARAFFEQVVARDQRHEKGWFWLASVVDTEEEQRICLGNVIVINPQNAEAQQLLDRLGELPASSGGIGMLVLLAAGCALLAVVVAILVLALPGPDTPDDPEPTQALVVNANPFAFVSLNPTSTPQTPRITSTPLATPTVSTTVQPTWTALPPTDTPDTTQILRVAPMPSPGLGGWIIMHSGHMLDPQNQPIVLIKPDGSRRYDLTLPGERGHTPVLSPDLQRYAFIHYVTGTQQMILQHARLDGTGAAWYWAGTPLLTDQDTPDWSPNGDWIAFTARGYGAQIPDLYRVSIGVQPRDNVTLERLTDDNTAESWPSFSPDSRFIVYAALPASGTGQELRIYNLQTGTSTDLTTNGRALTETAPDWSPDARNVVFEALAEGETQTDIYMIDASGLTEPRKIIESDAADIWPRFSPDGRYIVFSSNRTGNWDVYIYDLTTETLYQLTDDPQLDVANDWG